MPAIVLVLGGRLVDDAVDAGAPHVAALHVRAATAAAEAAAAAAALAKAVRRGLCGLLDASQGLIGSCTFIGMAHAKPCCRYGTHLPM